MLVFPKAGCGMFKKLMAGCGMEHIEKTLKNGQKASFSKIFVVFVDKGSFASVHGLDDLFPLEYILYGASVMRLVGASVRIRPNLRVHVHQCACLSISGDLGHQGTLILIRLIPCFAK